jgi:hypothetical protein
MKGFYAVTLRWIDPVLLTPMDCLIDFFNCIPGTGVRTRAFSPQLHQEQGKPLLESNWFV